MNDSSPPIVARPVLEPVQLAAGAVAAMAAVACAANLLFLNDERGTIGWRPVVLAFSAAAGGYFLLSSLAHLNRGAKSYQQGRGEVWLALSLTVLAAFILIRGASSRLILVGLSPAIAAVGTSACVSLLVALRPALTRRPSKGAATHEPVNSALDAWRCVLAAAMLIGVAYLELQPLPEAKPWERTPTMSR